MTTIEYFTRHTTHNGGVPIKYKCLLSGESFYWEYADSHICRLNKTGKYELIK